MFQSFFFSFSAIGQMGDVMSSEQLEPQVIAAGKFYAGLNSVFVREHKNKEGMAGYSVEIVTTDKDGCETGRVNIKIMSLSEWPKLDALRIFYALTMPSTVKVVLDD